MRKPDDNFSTDANFLEMLPMPSFHDEQKRQSKERPPGDPDIAIRALLGVCFRIVEEEFLHNHPVCSGAFLDRPGMLAFAVTANERVNVCAPGKFGRVVRPKADHIPAFRTADMPIVHGRLSCTVFTYFPAFVSLVSIW